MFLENRISDCLNTFLTGPLLDRQATLEGARKPPVEVLVQAANEVTYTFLFGYDSLTDFPSINDGQIRC